jgi:hypothetical protein
MLPYHENINDLMNILNPDLSNKTRTFAINTTDNIVGGKIDGLDALKQSIYLMLSIEADKYIIYPYTYGVNTLDLIGKPYYYVIAVLPGRIKTTLSKDDRITDVSDFEFRVDGKKLHVSFVVHTIYGIIPEEMTVRY